MKFKNGKTMPRPSDVKLKLTYMEKLICKWGFLIFCISTIVGVFGIYFGKTDNFFNSVSMFEKFILYIGVFAVFMAICSLLIVINIVKKSAARDWDSQLSSIYGGLPASEPSEHNINVTVNHKY